MKPEQASLLLAEFETSWQQIFTIDNRRGAYFLCYCSVFAALISATAIAFAITANASIPFAFAVTVAFSVHGLFGSALIGVYESERAANVRYRQKINLIREIFLASSGSEILDHYLSQKQLGIKVFSGSGNEIDKLGGTLKVMYRQIRYQQAAAALLVVGTWIQFVAPVSAA